MADEPTENTNSSKYRSVIVGGAGALAVAIVGSAFWDFIFKPIFLWLGERVVVVTNLGSSALSDSMYSDIAKGSYERAAVFILAGLAGVIAALVSARFVTPTNLSKQPKAVRWIVRGTMVGLVGVILLQVNRTFFTVRAANHLEQMQRIVGPYVSEERRLQLASSVALIRTKEAYNRMLEELEAIASAQKLSVPDRP
ncbi:hypothetical protein [Bradyrhizobium sp. McL0615]|uniref:hypothetical protein n=1 Tax=Bradyrhizobium sp. McL0615 TaxID=3415673 RepID=UPI003CF7C242